MRTSSRMFIAAVIFTGLAFSLHAQLIGYTATGAVADTSSSGLDDLAIGRQFMVTGSGITVRDLGVWDADGDGLSEFHTVSLFQIVSGAGAANATVTPVPGGTVSVGINSLAALDQGFRIQPLPTPIYLAPGMFSLIVYTLNGAGNDPYADGGGLPAGGNVTDIRFDPFQFASFDTPNYPNGGDVNNHTSGTFFYDLGNTVPEPSTFALLGTGLLAVLALGRRRARA